MIWKKLVKFPRFNQKKHPFRSKCRRAVERMFDFSVGDNDELVVIVFVKRSVILVTPVKINSLFGKRHVYVEDFMLDKGI